MFETRPALENLRIYKQIFACAVVSYGKVQNAFNLEYELNDLVSSEFFNSLRFILAIQYFIIAVCFSVSQYPSVDTMHLKQWLWLMYTECVESRLIRPICIYHKITNFVHQLPYVTKTCEINSCMKQFHHFNLKNQITLLGVKNVAS